jgi:hypothetical protein
MTFETPVTRVLPTEPIRQFDEVRTNQRIRTLMNAVNELQTVIAQMGQDIQLLKTALTEVE